jgi:hypothetical protein
MFSCPLVQHGTEQQEAKNGNRQPDFTGYFKYKRENKQSRRKTKGNNCRDWHIGHSFPRSLYIPIIAHGKKE